MFPSKSWEDIRPHILSILRLTCNPGRPSSVQTRRTRRYHFYMFLQNMGIDDDYFMATWSQDRRIWTMALYASHLCTGKTIRNKAIRASTVKEYLHDVATFILCNTGVDPRFEKGEYKLAEPIQKVLTEYERWEKQPNRRAPWTVAMQQHLDKVVATEQSLHGDNGFQAAISDWTGLGLSTGMRRSEWVQPDNKHSMLDNPAQHDDLKIIMAFLPGDWEFYDMRGRKVTHAEAILLGIENLSKLRVQWRTQKNGDNYKSKTYVINEKHPDLCPVRRGFRILERYHVLVGWNSPNVPLAVYQSGTTEEPTKRLLNSEQVTKVIRDTAMAVLHLHPKRDDAEIKKYSSHSLRVGACQILYANGFNAYEIKMLLRWKSDAFMVYLRDIAWVARKQNEAVSTVADEVRPFI